ncbi:MAG: metal-dependent hydrolase [Pseudomonadaceae bacterium]|nr:metal-dependent hydrolase [Pseudomonadaceae bacterium]
MPHDIEIRKQAFDFPPESAPIWHPEQPEWSHMVNGASLAMPYLEPFLIKTMREAVEQIEDEDLLTDVRHFIGQEAQHYTTHRRYNEMLKANGYPELADVEASMTRDYERFAKKSLEWRLAYAAGFETMTMGITEWLINHRDELFHGADPVVASLVLWHMVEETEHKSVAFDVYQSVSGRWLPRVWGLLRGSLHVGFLSRRGYRAMLKKDGKWHSLRSRLALWHMVAKFFVHAGSAMLRATLPGHHPDETENPQWVSEWIHTYQQRDTGEPLMLDTRRAGLPIG